VTVQALGFCAQAGSESAKNEASGMYLRNRDDMVQTLGD
jgi:hypothetical protein